jgi:hypothetical protein
MQIVCEQNFGHATPRRVGYLAGFLCPVWHVVLLTVIRLRLKNVGLHMAMYSALSAFGVL